MRAKKPAMKKNSVIRKMCDVNSSTLMVTLGERVVDRPEARDHARDEREAGVEYHTQQQRERPYGVEGVQTIGVDMDCSSKRSPRCAMREVDSEAERDERP